MKTSKRKDKNRKLRPESNSHSKDPRLEGLKEEHLETYAQRCQLATLMNNDVSASKAISHLSLSWTRRTANNIYSRFQQQGFRGLIDKRWLRQPAKRVFTDEVKAITLFWYYFRPAAGPVAIWGKVREICKEKGIAAPCQTTVKMYLAGLDEGLKLFRKGKPGIREWQQTACPVIRYENTTYANELWQGDHTPLRIWVRVRVNGEWKPFKAYLTLLLDAHTRAIPGYVVSTKYPDAWTIALAFRRAIMLQENRDCEICGIPKVFESDRGRDFISIAIKATLAGLGCMPCPDPPYYPNSKGKCERIFLTIDKGCLRLLPGHMDAIGITERAALKHVHEFLTLQQLDREIAIWIDQKYHKRNHSETRREPAAHWKETVLLHTPESEDDLNLLLMKYDKNCTVRNTGIKFTLYSSTHRFWSPELADYFKQEVKIRYNPEDMDSVLVYCAASGDFLCEAFDMLAVNQRYTIDDVKRTRRQYRLGVLQRIKMYLSEVYQNDRDATARAERLEEARQLANKLEAQEPELSPDNFVTGASEVQELLRRFKQQDSNNLPTSTGTVA